MIKTKLKFAIRDDDLNYFYSPEFIEKSLHKLWEICPISMSVIPYVKGNWVYSHKMLEKYGPGKTPKNILDKITADDKIYDIAENHYLTTYLKEKIKEQKISLTLHGIHHRNSKNLNKSDNSNQYIGAEFFTDEDFTDKLRVSIDHIEKVFSVKIQAFTPPQNVYSKIGLKAIANNNLNLCASLPPARNIINLVLMFRNLSVLRVLNHKIACRRNKAPYTKPLAIRNIKIVDHVPLQPNTNVNELYRKFNYAYSKGGVFVVSTHSYAFGYMMRDNKETMGNTLKKFLEFVSLKDDVEFVSIDKLFL